MTLDAANTVECVVGTVLFLWLLGVCVQSAWMHRRAQATRDIEMAYVAERSSLQVVLVAWVVQGYVLMALDVLVLSRPGDGRVIEWMRLLFYAVAQSIWMQTLFSVLRVTRQVRRIGGKLTFYIYMMLALASWSSSDAVRITAAAICALVNVVLWLIMYRWSWHYSERTTAIGAVMICAPLAFICHAIVWLLDAPNLAVLPPVAASVLYAFVDIPMYAVAPLVIVVSRWRITCREHETEENEIWSSGRAPGHATFERYDSYRNRVTADFGRTLQTGEAGAWTPSQ